MNLCQPECCFQISILFVLLITFHVYVATTEQSTTVSAKEDNDYLTVFTNYAKFHQQSLAQEHKGNFLIYVCNSVCGGYGNRIHGITMSLLFAILSNRTFLIQMSHPFDINQLLHPNAIQWNYTGYRNMKNVIKKDFNLVDAGNLKNNWLLFSTELLNPNVSIITFLTNLGFQWYFKIFDDKWNKLFRDHFNITKNNNILTYGYVIRYLFTYDKIVTNAIDKEMQELGLIPGLYVSVHFRSFSDAPAHVHPSPGPFLSRAVEIANNMSKNSSKHYKVYFISDLQKAKEVANTKYHGLISTSHVKEVHVDKDRTSVFEGFVGVIVNIEVAAKGAVFVRSGSTFADLIESIGQFNKSSVINISW